MALSSFHVATNPLVGHKLGHLCDSKTHTAEYRRLLREISFILGSDATTAKHYTSSSVAIISMVKAETGMMNAMLEWVEDALVMDVDGQCNIVSH